jgi:hypothetical protein
MKALEMERTLGAVVRIREPVTAARFVHPVNTTVINLLNRAAAYSVDPFVAVACEVVNTRAEKAAKFANHQLLRIDCGPMTKPMVVAEPMGPYDDEIWAIWRSNWRLMPWRMI